MRILLADNNDSFTRNLEHCIYAATGVASDVVPYEELLVAPDRYAPQRYDVLVISPGPGHPEEYMAGYGRYLDSGMPVLGICMGLQIINQHFGGESAPFAACAHGVADAVIFGGQGVAVTPVRQCLLNEISGQRRQVARYHSLYLSRVGDGLVVFGENQERIPMAVCHAARPLLGYQFHPESFLTEDGEWFIAYALRVLCTV